jgi:hypothetical protein
MLRGTVEPAHPFSILVLNPAHFVDRLSRLSLSNKGIPMG